MNLTNIVLTKLTTKVVGMFVGDVENVDTLKFDGPRIIVANHSSYMDHFVILYLLKKQNPKQSVYFLTKKEAFERSFSRWWHLSLNCIPVDRNQNALTSMMTLKDKLINENAVVVIYPEGTRTPNGRMYHGKSGAESLSYATKVQIVPIGMHGVFDVLPKFTVLPKFRKVSVKVGKEVRISKSDRKEIPKISTSNIKYLSELAQEQLEVESIESINVKDEMLRVMFENNQKALRDYPDDIHTPFEYHRCVIYIGRILLKKFDVTTKEKSDILKEMARAFGRLGYLKGVKTSFGRYYMKKTTAALKEAAICYEKDSEWYYIKGHQYLFLGDKKRYLENLIEANAMEENRIQYKIALAKAMILNNKFISARTILLAILKMSSDNQVDARRKVEAKVMMMRLDPNFGTNQGELS